MWRRHPRCGFIDPQSGRYLELWTEGVLPSDDPLEGLRQWNIYCRVSRDGGRSFGPVRPIVHEGEFNRGHPLPGVWTIPAQATPIRTPRCCMAAGPGIICSGGCRN
jgi:hypothetical protein